MDFTKTVIGSLVVLAWTSGAMAILAEDYVAIRILEPPDVHPPPDCLTFLMANHSCGAGPGFAGGISNDGDVFGVLETDHPHQNALHDAARWLRSTNYDGENVRRMVLAGAGPGGLAYGYQAVRKVTSNGFAWGAGNPGLVRYDIQNDEWKYFGRSAGCAGGGNSKGRGVAACQAGGDEPDEDEYPRVVDAKLVGDEPFDGSERGDLYRFADEEVRPQDINNADIIVGHLAIPGECRLERDGVCLFQDPASARAMKVLPDGVDRWGEAILMDQFDPDLAARVHRISDSDPPYGIGFSTAAEGKKAAVWNVTTGEIAADLGGLTELQAINSSGTMIVGFRNSFGFPPPPPEHLIWWSEDGWQTVHELSAEEIRAVAPGGEHIEVITKLTGINDHGQVSAQGLIRGEFGEYLTPGVSNWGPAVATDPTCPNSHSEWKAGNGCGIPLVLDTMGLAPGAVIGDVNDDGEVNNLDITTFIGALAAADEAAFLVDFPDGNYDAADIDGVDGPTNLDITPFITRLAAAAGTSGTSAAVPEPSSICLLALALASSMVRPRYIGRAGKFRHDALKRPI